MAFQIPGYRWLWANYFASAAGFMPFRMAQGWLILEMTDSPFMVGLAPGLGSAASMLLSPLGGVLVDRLNRRVILIMSQVVMGSAILTLGLLTVTDSVEVWHILVVTMVHQVMMGLQIAARDTLMYDVVGRGALMNAMALQSLSSHSASVFGPLGAGFLMAGYGSGPLFLVIGIIILLGSVLLIPVKVAVTTARPVGSVWRNLKEGIDLAAHDRPIRTVMWTVLVTDGLGYSSSAMFPVVTRDILHAGPVVLGLLATFRGIGGIIGGLVLSSLGDMKGKGFIFIGAAVSFGTFLLFFAFSRNLPLSLTFILLSGASSTAYETMAHTLLQVLSPEAMRGRIMGLYSLVVSGIGFGALGMGAVASWLGVTWAIAGGGSTLVINALTRVHLAKEINDRSTVGWEDSKSGS